MYLLDTNVISELRRLERTNPRVAAWADQALPQALFLSAMTIFELELGIARLLRKDPKQASVLRLWLQTQVLPTFKGHILPIDEAVARRCGPLHVPDQRSERDAFIAATALEHKLIVVSRNVADFEPMGVQTLNPWLATS